MSTYSHPITPEDPTLRPAGRLRLAQRLGATRRRRRPAGESVAAPNLIQTFDAAETEQLIVRELYGRRSGTVEVLRRR
jgi:hypothetical protein